MLYYLFLHQNCFFLNRCKINTQKAISQKHLRLLTKNTEAHRLRCFNRHHVKFCVIRLSSSLGIRLSVRFSSQRKQGAWTLPISAPLRQNRRIKPACAKAHLSGPSAKPIREGRERLVRLQLIPVCHGGNVVLPLKEPPMADTNLLDGHLKVL